MENLKLRFPPILVFLAVAALVWVSAFLLPGDVNLHGAGNAFLVIGIGAGAYFGITGISEFRRARTTTSPTKLENVSAIVSAGIYSKTRNPMYLGLQFMLLGWAIYQGNLFSIAIALGFAGYITLFQIIPEEATLEENFGEEYMEYKARVRRWM
ncbi:isoprenylcysteine carboxylmethyltransferase family protein [Pseudovibrio sp. Tun.PSC04-5.I4]|uniref:methyltransferase family protein n=1 Tax=Pseudovibrio sp. Tun.PSC04-5.I4 TaxID=1798213 RepID=UPI000886479B|nr:isoprenylcysteine carboxylmethyltransferase family protein [Pseudovibrio sp. Tun.PSC04-5.I4]SDR24509.1 Protein-S-isoprenylcysteine O-methyltransferase Ste14 [Pseudovibrio sp. Tun.PSC04-5.I4]